MNIKKTLFMAAMALTSMTAMAQQEPETEYVFQPHWYVQVQAGGQYTLGELKFSDLLSPTAQVALGYNFNKVLGARLAVNAWQSKAGSEINGTEYKWKYKYVAPAIDLTANLSNLFCGVNPKRVVSVGIFAGIGANIGFSNDEAAEAEKLMKAAYGTPIIGDDQYVRLLWDGSKVCFLGQFGANIDFRLSDAVSLGIEANATTLPDAYNSKKAGNTDWYFNALVGLKINLGKTYTERKKPAPEPVIVEKVVEKIVEKPVEVTKQEKIRRDIFFTLRGTEISMVEGTKIKEIAEYMEKYPNSHVTITGHADKGTGNAEINQGLSERRAAAVADILRTKYNIDADRISVEAKGDRENPYTENDLNRVSVCIAE